MRHVRIAVFLTVVLGCFLSVRANACVNIWQGYSVEGTWNVYVPCYLSSIASIQANAVDNYSAPYTIYVNNAGVSGDQQFILVLACLDGDPTCPLYTNPAAVPPGISYEVFDTSTSLACYNPADAADLGIPACPPPSIYPELFGAGIDGCGCVPGAQHVGEPIDVASGNVSYSFTDYATAGQNPLTFTRYLNSLLNVDQIANTMGSTWRMTYDRYLGIGSGSVIAERQDGQVLTFALTGGVWMPDSDVDMTLTQAGSGTGAIWTLTDSNDSVETYSQISATEAVVTSIQSRNGYTQTVAYNANNTPASVTDSYGRTLTFNYGGGSSITSVSTPDGLTISYGYLGANGNSLLNTVTYSTTPSSSQQMSYNTTNFTLLSVTDENGAVYNAWTYDQYGRGLTSQEGNGANLTTLTYDDTDGSRTVSNAQGVTDTYMFATLQNVPKVTQISRAATGTTSAATRTFAYDGNGYLASVTDWNGNETTYVNDSHGDPLTINEAVGTPVARTTTIVYDPTFVHLPDSIATPGATASFTYDSVGDVLAKTLTDTTTQSMPYSTNGQTRTWAYAWGNFLLASVKTPVGNLTQYTYDSTGAATAVSNALNQKTQITLHTPGGFPQTVIDPNNVTTNLTYSPRQWLLSTAVTTSKGVLTTSFGYDAAGNLSSVTLPDNSKLTNGYDTAHRLTSVTDLFSNAIAYTLDGFGDATLTNVTNSGNSVTRTHSGIFDALGRVLQDIGGAGQDTQYSYDPNGNAVTVTDPDTNLITRTFDALNRLSTITDPSPGGTTTTTYDAHDRPLTVTDPNSNVTSYTYDGFGEVIQLVSPDSGKTVYYYDADANLTKKFDATKTTTTMTYDALDRVLTMTYPADTKENVKYTYDQTGHGFGIGRLTSLKDAAGTLSRSYDERGNVLSEKRVIGTNSLQTTYTYDAASRVSSIRYPDAAVVTYTRDTMGRITKTTARAPGSGTVATVAANVAYEPFGPPVSFTYGNHVTEQRTYDLDYRLLNLSDSGRATAQNLTYGYDPANNVLSITDMVNSGNSQAFSYDPLNRLITASGSYGPLSWTYDPVGNRLTQTQGSTLTQYAYGPGNRLASITSAGVTQTVGSTAAGNISSFNPALGPVTTLTYNKANRLSVTDGESGLLASYTYDASGQRLEKVTTGPVTLYQYDLGGNLLEETNTVSGAQADYIYLNGRPLAAITPSTGALSFLHDDLLDTPQLATGSTQSTVWNAGGYQPFGQTGTVTGTITQNLRLPGQYFDSESGWNHNGFRDYVPNLGRYLEADPIGLEGGNNLYRYASDNPEVFKDILGLQDDMVGLRLFPFPMASGNKSDLGEAAVIFPDGVLDPVPVLLGTGPFHTNCHGYTLLNGQYWVQPNQVPRLLAIEGYTPVDESEVQSGDIVVYYDMHGGAAHSAQVLVGYPQIVLIGKNGTGPVQITFVGSPDEPYQQDRKVYYRH
jgi:RHS repeat-associated protein